MRRTRRLFTRPFVVTALGGGVAVAAGCPAPTSVNTRPAESRRPEHGAAAADPGAARDVAPSSVAETLPFAENTIEPPERQPGELRWTVRVNYDIARDQPPAREPRWERDVDGCVAQALRECPKLASCNPPAPKSTYACPEDVAPGHPLVIYRPVDSADCFVVPQAYLCAPDADCAPPPLRRVPCPSE